MGYIDANCDGKAGPDGKWVANQGRCDNTGVFYGNSKVSIKHITDGTSKTFLIGERDRFCLSATWIGVRNPLDGAEMWSSRWAMAHVFFPLNYATTGHHDTCTETFSSAHPGGGYFAFCDGSVRFINDDINFDNLVSQGQTKTCFAKRQANPSLYCRTQLGDKAIGVYQRLAWRDDDVVLDEGDF
jgi:prepilin-type processing-associated H-X9-DG protein